MDRKIEIGMRGVSVRESISLDNPLFESGSLSDVFSLYEQTPSPLTDTLRCFLKTQCLSLLKIRGQTEAENIVLCASGFYLNILFGRRQSTPFSAYGVNVSEFLPCKNCSVLPPYNDWIDGGIFCETVALPENSLALFASDVLTLIAIGKDANTLSCMWGMDYRGKESRAAVRAAIHTLRADATPLLYLFGGCERFFENIAVAENLTLIPSRRDFSRLTDFSSPSFRARLQTDRRRTSFRDLLKDEDFLIAMTNFFAADED